MSSSAAIGLEKLMLRYPRAKLRGSATAHLSISTLGDTPIVIAQPDASVLENLWICRGRNLRLEVYISIDGQPLLAEDSSKLGDALTKAKIWNQLGLRIAANNGDVTFKQLESSSYVSVVLQYVEESNDKKEPSLYNMCYKIPPSDVAAPKGVASARADAIRIDMTILRHQSAKRTGKRRKTDLDMLVDSGDDELLLTPLNEDVTESAAILAMVDAALRRNILGDPGKHVQRHPFASGLTAKFLDTPTPLNRILPSVFSPGYLEAMSTRAALLPTIAHALSHSLYSKTRSPDLRSKLQHLYRAPQNEAKTSVAGNGQDDVVDFAPGIRYERVSAELWKLLQTQTRNDRPTPKLHPITASTEELDAVDSEEEDLFASQVSDSQFVDSGFEDEMLASAWLEEDDDLLFTEVDPGDGYGDEEDFFGEGYSQLDSPPQFSPDDALLDDIDDDLLLDLMLDEGFSEDA